jgi:hypothetical protein
MIVKSVFTHKQIMNWVLELRDHGDSRIVATVGLGKTGLGWNNEIV